MSTPNSRVSSFVQRAKKLSSYSNKSPSITNSSETPPKLKLFDQKDSSQDSEKLKSVVHKSIERGSPVEQVKTTKEPKNPTIEHMQRVFENFLKSRKKAKEEQKTIRETEEKVIERIKNSIRSEKERYKSYSKTEELESAYKNKSEKVMNIVQEQALKMDKKLSELQEENARLKQQLAAKTLTSVDGKIKSQESGSSYLETYSQKATEALREVPDTSQLLQNYKDNLDKLCSELCKGILEEQQQRLKTEENTNQVLSAEEKKIAELEAKIKDLQLRNHSKSVDKLMESNNSPRNLYEDETVALDSLSNSVLQNVYSKAIEDLTKSSI